MDDFSDDGGDLPGQSFFKKRVDEIEEKENNENVYNNDNYEEHYYKDDENYYYENNKDKYYDNYNDNNYENFNNEDYNEYEEMENYNNFDNYNQYDENNDYHGNYYDYNRNKYKNNYKYNKHYKYNNKYNYHQGYKAIKSKENYIALFKENFKLWLTLVIKMASDKDKKICLSNNSEVNKEIIDSFIKYYDYKSNNLKLKEKNNLQINIENIEMKQTVGKNYNIEFFIVIEDKIEIFFVDKYIRIKVSGEIFYDKFPKFSFDLEQYKLSLNYNEENDDNDNIINNITSDEKTDFEIGMCPEYNINNKDFNKIYLKINGEQNIKDPQKEIRECLDNLIKYINYEKKPIKNN